MGTTLVRQIITVHRWKKRCKKIVYQEKRASKK